MTITKKASDKYFIINRSKLYGRIDATAYREMFSFVSKIYQNKKLSDIALINPNTTFNKLKPDDEITFIPMEAVDDRDGIVSTHLTKPVSKSKGFTRFRENDLIWAKITPCMQNGKSAVVKQTLNGYACGSTEFYIIRPKDDSVKVEYLHYLLRDQRILDNAQNFFGGSAGQQRVSKDFLINFTLPIPPLIIQEKIIKIINDANSKKQQKEAQAKQFLENINTYLLSELDISLKQKNRTIKERIFISSFKEVIGLRFDPLYFINVGNIESKKYDNVPLRNIMQINKGQSITKEKITEGAYPVIAGGQTSPYNHHTYNFKGDVITISASGAYSGYVWYHDNPIFASDCNVLKSKDESKVSTSFVYYILKALQSEIYKLQQGAGQPHVYARDLEKFTIPLPPLPKQKDILSHVEKVQRQIGILKAEAKSILENAKAEVEKILLG